MKKHKKVPEDENERDLPIIETFYFEQKKHIKNYKNFLIPQLFFLVERSHMEISKSVEENYETYFGDFLDILEFSVLLFYGLNLMDEIDQETIKVYFYIVGTLKEDFEIEWLNTSSLNTGSEVFNQRFDSYFYDSYLSEEFFFSPIDTATMRQSNIIGRFLFEKIEPKLPFLIGKFTEAMSDSLVNDFDMELYSCYRVLVYLRNLIDSDFRSEKKEIERKKDT